MEGEKPVGTASKGCKLTELYVDNHKVVRLENDCIRVGIDVDQGAHIFELVDKRNDVDVLYKDPKGLSKHDVGGWYELFPNAGKACRYQDKDIPSHGDIRSVSWTYQVEVENEREIRISLSATSNVLSLRLDKKLVIKEGQSCLYMTEEITNASSEEQFYLWGHHVTFGSPFVSPHCRIDLPECRVYKRSDYGQDHSRLAPLASGSLHEMPGKDGGYMDVTRFPNEPCSEMLFVDELDSHWYNLYNSELSVGCALSWSHESFPYLWIWQENGATQQQPFFGKVKSMALEPQSSNVPILANAVKQNQAPSLQPEESRKSWMTLVLHNSHQRVRFVSNEGIIQYEEEK